jgi:Double sensory domain of two-component sensor kinase
MSLYFFANNFHFALELLGAVALLMAAWLTFDTYSVSKEGKILVRTVGFGLVALWQVITAVSAGSDLLSFFGFALYAIGLACILGSFLINRRLALPAILVIPPFAAFAGPLHGVAAILLLAIAYASYRQSKIEFNKTWRPFSAAFLLLGAASALTIFAGGNETILFLLVGYALELAGFLLLAAWVWQFLALRIRESLVIIFISAALLLSTVVTLAFSTILINQITSQTEANLLTNARTLDLTIKGLKQESLAEAALFASDPRLPDAVATNDFPTLQTLAESFMEQYSLGFVTVVDRQGAVLIRAHALSKRGDSLAGERALEEALAGKVFVTVEKSPVEKLSIRAGAPVMRKGKAIGAVIAGYPLDNALVDGIKRVTGLEMFVYENGTSVAATAFAADGRTRLTNIPLQNSEVENAVLKGGRSVTAQASFSGQLFLASYLPLTSGDDKIVGMLSAAKPEQDILDIINATNRLTLITVILIMLVLAFPIYLFAKRLTNEG